MMYLLLAVLFGLLEMLGKRLNLEYIHKYGGDISLGVATDFNVLLAVLIILQKDRLLNFLLDTFKNNVFFVMWTIIFVIMLITVKATIFLIARTNKDDSTLEEIKFELSQEIRACTNILLLIVMLLVYMIPMDCNTEDFVDGFLKVSTLWLLMNTIEDQTVNREVIQEKNK